MRDSRIDLCASAFAAGGRGILFAPIKSARRPLGEARTLASKNQSSGENILPGFMMLYGSKARLMP